MAVSAVGDSGRQWMRVNRQWVDGGSRRPGAPVARLRLLVLRSQLAQLARSWQHLTLVWGARGGSLWALIGTDDRSVASRRLVIILLAGPRCNRRSFLLLWYSCRSRKPQGGGFFLLTSLETHADASFCTRVVFPFLRRLRPMPANRHTQTVRI